jgi:hypothetical protein
VNTAHTSKRILALDLLRGYFLCVIIIDHLFRIPNIFEVFTGRGQLWVSAAEGFFIISGLLIGNLYGPRVLTDFISVLQKTWKRAARLWFYSVTLTLLFTIWGSQLPAGLIKSGLWPGGSLTKLLTDTLTFRYVYGWTDFLPYYAVFMLVAPFALYLAKKTHVLVLVAFSLTVWYFRGSNFYLAWQSLFILGLVIGLNLSKFESTVTKFSSAFTTIFVITAGLSVYFVFVRHIAFSVFDKDTLEPGRLLLSLIWFAAAFSFFRLRSGFSLLNLFGQNSLFVYILHALILFPLNLLFPYSGNFIINSAINTGVIGCIFLITSGYKNILLNIMPNFGIPSLLRMPYLLFMALISRIL